MRVDWKDATPMIDYPLYYQSGPVCIKRESATSGKKVTIPNSAHTANYGFEVVNMRDKNSFDSLLTDMEEVSNEVYETYLITLHPFTQRQSASFREMHDLTPEFSGQGRLRS